MFQTVKCPQCGKSSIEYPDAKLSVTCAGCHTKFKPFAHLKATTTLEPTSKSKATKSVTPSHADQIFEQIKNVIVQFDKCQKTEGWTKEEEQILNILKAELSVLYTIIRERLVIGVPTLKADLNTAFTFSQLSDRPQKLGVILAFLYITVTILGEQSSKMMFDETEHWIFSHDTIELYKSELSKLVNIP